MNACLQINKEGNDYYFVRCKDIFYVFFFITFYVTFLSKSLLRKGFCAAKLTALHYLVENKLFVIMPGQVGGF